MKPQKEKKEKESFWNALIIYGFIAIALIGFLGYIYGSIAIGTMFIIAPLLFKGAGTSKDGMFTKSPTNKVKDVWQGADKKKKAGIVVGIVALLPFFILGIVWLAMMGAMFFVDMLFILPILLIILWVWFRNPSHQTFSGSASFGHPAVLAVAVIMLLLIGIVAGMNYMQLHKYDGLSAYKVIQPLRSANATYHTDTDNDGQDDFNDPDVDGDGIPNNLDIDINGDGYIDNWGKVMANWTSYNETTKQMIKDQWNSIPEENRAYYDPKPMFSQDDFIVKNGTITAKKYNVVFHVYDPFANNVFPEQTTMNYVSMGNIMGHNLSFPMPVTTQIPTTTINFTKNNTNSTIARLNNGTAMATFSSMKLPLGATKGMPIEGVYVSLIANGTDKKYINPETGLASWIVTTDASGTCMIHNIPAGDYVLRVDGGGYLPFNNMDFRVTKANLDNLITLTPAYFRVTIYFDSHPNAEQPVDAELFNTAHIALDGKEFCSLSAEVEGMKKSDYENILRQNAMYSWSGVPAIAINPSVKTNKMFESMFNDMAGGLNAVLGGSGVVITGIQFLGANLQVSANYAQGDLSGSKDIQTPLTIVSGNPHITKQHVTLVYVGWAKGMIRAQNGAQINIHITGTAKYNVAEAVADSYLSWSWNFLKGKEGGLTPHFDTKTKNIAVEVPMSENLTYSIIPQNYQVFYQT